MPGFWKVPPNLTLNLGLRYGLNTPVYEHGFQLVPNVNLGDISSAETARALGSRITS